MKRFWDKVEKTKSCWEWKAFIGKYGYGRFHYQKRPHDAHRVSYWLLVGDIPKDKVIDHICRNRACVNPAHMQLVTRGQNVLLGIGASAMNMRKGLCPKGHKYDGIKKSGDRFCKTCKNEVFKAWYQKNKNRVNEYRRKNYNQ